MSGDEGARFARSKELYEAALKVIPGGVTSSIRAGTLPHPIYFERGEGPYLWDVDGHRYLDFVLAFGPPFLGYAPEVLNRAIIDQVGRGLTFGSQHPGEPELAELMVDAVPGAEQVVFALSGSDAVTVALRIARVTTGRRKVVKFEGHYHGWHDTIWASVGVNPERSGPADRPATVPQTAGIPADAVADLIVAPWNDIDAVSAIFEEHGRDIAALILEPLNVNGGVIHAVPGFLAALRDLTTRHGSLLIFDEIITGFRIAYGGAQERYGVTADLAIFAKAMAGGVAVSAVTGPRALMEVIADKRLLHNGTFNGNPLAFAAAIATLRHLGDGRATIYPRLDRLGARLAEGMRRTGRLTVRSEGPIVATWIGEPDVVRNVRDRTNSDLAGLARLAYGLLLGGIHSRGLWYLSTAHEEAHVDEAIARVHEVLEA